MLFKFLYQILYYTKIIKHIKREMFEFFFITIFFNIKFIEILKSFSHSFFFLFHLNITFFFITQKMTKISRSITNRLNMINDFLTEIEDYDIIILSKSNLDDELIKIDTL